ncbi:TrkA C-terminal domain-containing protein [Anaerosalibacter bizertensis]|uniref:TrkA C-terminal domain-containing protein n=1 Tax=Anaerosalibacter bizertensis TaxID=932217 RepID=UPI00176C9878|nr:GntR family transcriptional regulator [Tissierellia bacterium]
MKKSHSRPKYITIALDIAYRIYNNDLKEGERVSGRSVLASEYNVSPETIRKSISLLRDMDVVRVTPKSGILILSRDKAFNFIQEFDTKDNLIELKHEIFDLMNKKTEIEKNIKKNIESIVDYSIQLKNIGLIYPFELEVPKNSPILGKSPSDIRFWQHTNATIIGVRRNNKIIVSPGPYIEFKENDIILFIGKNACYDKVKKLIN